MSGGFTLSHTSYHKTEVTIDEHVKKMNANWNPTCPNWMMFGGHPNFATRELENLVSP